MSDELHPVVKLLVARMESHPQEFGRGPISNESEDRWWRVRETIENFGTEGERAAIQTAMREIELRNAHEWMMDELCNGDERRRKEREALEARRKVTYAAQSAQQQAASLQQQAVPQYGSQLASTVTGTNTLTDAYANTLTDAYANMKKALGL